MCKMKWETPLFHLGKNFGPFRQVLAISATSVRYANFGRYEKVTKISLISYTQTMVLDFHVGKWKSLVQNIKTKKKKKKKR